MNLIPGSSATASALQAHTVRLETIAQNIANADTTRGPDGKPYQRQMVSFESELDAFGQTCVKIAGVESDRSPGTLVSNPGHPHADENGMVQMPNVHPSIEMVDMIAASRAYEANLSVAKTAHQMALKTLEIGRA
ncbi:flagellar basal body rod protein FlgC [Ruficoccus amylovorans]|uniref:Flagellar basal-body rod protein FlgC n=1 Tax=Ruficoccus amylovorans TaxID=1804625 RepID=A0A842HHG0_9BACT|nr:flagellar basal body rod protein FlgC [Ruficoccus amylovorans]MBC2595004.1 flagellar basal body rod protein FlgC [Ruficoccus amylovorans]